MLNCNEINKLQTQYIKRALDFVKIHASHKPVINSIKFNQKNKKVEICYNSLYDDCLKISYEDFEDKKFGVIKYVLKMFGSSVKEPSVDELVQAKQYITEKDYTFNPCDENMHLNHY